MGSRKNNQTLLIWDSEGAHPIKYQKTLLWSSLNKDEHPNTTSIPFSIEENANQLKSRYLAWVYELGETCIKGRRVVDYLELRPGFSYWWMTLIAEKCNWAKSPQIYEVIKLFAFEDWIKTQPVINRIFLVTTNVTLSKSVGSWCDNHGIEFVWEKSPIKKKQLSFLRNIYKSLPNTIQALMWLVQHLIQRWPLRNVGIKEWTKSNAQMTFISYFDNLDPDALVEGKYESKYWAHLPDVLQKMGFESNWLHFYIKDSLLPNARTAVETIRKFNSNNDKKVHILLEAFLSLKVIIKTLSNWIWLIYVGRFLRKQFSKRENTEYYLFHFFQKDWDTSFFGKVALNNLLYLHLIESSMEAMPVQNLGIYLQENQPWEFALIHAWRSSGHKKLIGVPHTTIRFWDFRYFFDPRNYQNCENNLPLPDFIATNGQNARSAYKDGGYSELDLLEVEALRYLHLNRVKTVSINDRQPTSNPLRILLLGDYLLLNTKKQIQLILEFVKIFKGKINIVVKPHPNCIIQPNEYPNLDMKVSNKPINKLLEECDIAFTSNVTSASVDAYCAGIPVISVLDPKSFNLSPLRDIEGVNFVTSSNELVKAVERIILSRGESSTIKKFFWLDPELPRWEKILHSYHGN
ncbi:hypothetical protein JYT44_00610 [Caldithrix abyssi]|nr:hypothetical protein [Caldithrix abyssi]